MRFHTHTARLQNLPDIQVSVPTRFRYINFVRANGSVLSHHRNLSSAQAKLKLQQRAWDKYGDHVYTYRFDGQEWRMLDHASGMDYEFARHLATREAEACRQQEGQ